jgi:hypothetical protein
MTDEVRVSAEAASIPPGHPLAKLPWIGGGVGVLAAVACFALVAAGAGDPRELVRSWLVAFAFFLSIALGALFFVLLHHLTRAGWSTLVRRLAEHAAATLPLFALLFLPIAFGLGELYHWAEPGAAAHDPVLAGKHPFLNPTAFYLRAAVYFAVWGALGGWYRRRSIAQDGAGDPAISRRLQSLSAPAMLAFGVTLTFAAFDWLMSLDPHWYSTIFGVYYFAGCAVAVYAALSIAVLALQQTGVLADEITPEHFHDLGKMLFAFVVFWAYIAFSQFLLIWYGNIPEETEWYAHRLGHGWREVTVALALGHFVIPFFYLLPRGVKRRRGTLLAGALWMLAVHYLDLYWLAMPGLRPDSPRPHLSDGLAFLAVGGLFVAAVGWLARRPALVPVRDPRLAESLSFENL